jgi:adenine-specific DNA-methyltransferase
MEKLRKLELTWIGKENRPRLEPRILLEDPAKSYHAALRVSDNDLFDNRLIFGDNLLALKALEQEFTGKIKCIYIDPPYNTGSAFTHYDDGIEHSLWLSLMRDRLELLRRLLAEDGSIWISIDDTECHYLKVMLDELFGRPNFVANVLWQKSATRENRTDISTSHEHVLVYAKERETFRAVVNRLPSSDEQIERYENPDNDSRGPWASLPAHAKAEKGRRQSQFYDLIAPNGKVHRSPAGTCWRFTEDRYAEMLADNRIWFGASGNNAPRIKKFLSEVQTGLVPNTLWLHSEVGTTGTAKAEVIGVVPGETPFSTPKPERLIERICTIATNPGDWILDSFAGSGTTGAVAHKMGRRWIMVELGDHCHTHIIPRMKKVIDGKDPGGVTGATGWKGGGGFRYYHLAPSLLKKDKFENWVISPEFNEPMLAEAVCKLEGFTYAPSDSLYWQHGYSTERDFIYVTTQALTRDMLAKTSDEVGDGRTLLVVCKAFTGKQVFANLTVKKIPKAVMAKCEWGKDDYSFEIKNLPQSELPLDGPAAKPKLPVLRGAKKAKASEPSLFATEPATEGQQ